MRLFERSARHILMIIVLSCIALPAQLYAAMGDYCIMPPYVKRDIKPNVMIMMDNAADMGDQAYNDSYDKNKTYSGYFKPGLKYTYSTNRWVPDTSGIYSGNLLNWVTTSKYDLLENILVGGISTSRQTNVNTLVSKSNTWQKTISYNDSLGTPRTCVFNVNNANVEVTESTAGACGYLDGPSYPAPYDTPHPIPNDPGAGVASIGSDERFAENPDQQQKNYRAANSIKNPAPATPGFWSAILSAIGDYLIPSAEAASFHISGGPSTLPGGTECTPYSVSISASGGTGSGYTWSWVATSPSTTTPPGLTLGASGTPSTTISGTPTTSGTYYFTVQATDSGGNSDTKGYSITVTAVTFDITTNSLSDGTFGQSYSASLSATAGVCTPYTWSISSGSLPLGLSINSSTGVISGTPFLNLTSTYYFTVQVSNSAGRTAIMALQLTINSLPQLTITTGSPLPAGAKGSSYSTTITEINDSGAAGVKSWTWLATSPSTTTPPGLTLTCSGSGDGTCLTSGVTTAAISGTPTAAGTYHFRITVYDNGSKTAYKDFVLTITTATIRTTGNRNVQVCTGNYTYNCASSLPTTYPWPANSGCSESDHTTCILKSGLVDQFWPQARFGVMDFSKYQNVHAQPNKEICIQNCTSLEQTDPQYCPLPSSNFMTAVENAVAIDPKTTLVNGEYEAVDYYKTGTGNGATDCNPYTNAQSCVKNFILILTGGVGADNPPQYDSLSTEVYSTATVTDFPSSACTSTTLSNLAVNSCYGYNVGDLRSDVAGRQYVTTYIVNTMGTATSGTSYNPDNTPVTTGDILYQAAKKGGGIYYEVQDPALLKAQLEQALQDIIKRAAAGTAASVLASGEGSGANLVQAVFYPRKQFGNDEISWIGRLSNLWYYVDPRFANSNIREDDGDKVLHLLTDGTHHDYITQLYFDSSTETTRARRWEDPNGNGTIGTQLTPDIDFESLGNLWEAGSLLWSRDIVASPRNIYTSLTGTLINFSAANRSALSTSLTASTDSEAEAIIRWVSGEDTPFSPAISPAFTPSPDYRHRTVSINGVGPYVWKLGDVLNSTPKISTWMPLSGYHKFYSDNTYGAPGQDPSLQDAADINHYITTARYKGRGMIFAGANDGMLHAFRLGTLQLKWTGMDTTYDKAKLSNNVCSGDSSIDCVDDAQCAAASAGTCSNTVTLGEEVWAFIPKNILPYLKYTADANYGGCHLYSVDLTPYIFDASIGGASDTPDTPRTPGMWRTILIGGMRYGGACRNMGTACAGGGTDCVKTPVDGLGYSAYFALDITNQNNPMLLWERSNAELPGLGFTTAGPAVVRINALTGGAPDKTKNGHWFVVLASGPTGPIDTTYKQFLGRSDQPLKLFVLNLKNGSLAGTISTGISDAFAGSMYNATLDTDLDYQDDVVYVPYVKQAGSTWTDGGVGRLATNGSFNNPTNDWTWSTLIDGIGPVTSAVTKLQNNSTHTLWAYFGTGRYYFEQSGTTDDGAGQRQIFGVKDPCFGVTGFHGSSSDSCTSLPLSWCATPTSATTCGVITNVTSTTNIPANPDAASFKGWYINLDGDGVPDASFKAERVITDPLATTTGVVFFTTYKPYSDECALGGKSFIWAIKYNNGGGAGSLLQGKALVQVSTGSIEQLNLSSAFTDAGGRKSAGMEGVPPTAQGLSILSTPAPVKRVLHIRER